MSTEAAPAAAVTEPPPLDPKGAPTQAQKDVLLSIFKPKGKVEVVKPKETKPAEVETKPAQTETKPAEIETKPAVAETKVETPKGEKTPEMNFAALRQKAEAAEKAAADAAAERDRLRTEYEEYKKKPAPDEVMKELEMTKKQKEEYQRELRIAALHRDPEFNTKYEAPIRSGMQQMVDILVASGVDKAEAVKHVPAWNKTFFAEAMEAMGPVEKLEFGAAMQGVVSLYNQKEGELANAEQTWKTLSEQREAAAKAQQESYKKALLSDIDAVVAEAGETPLGKEEGAVAKVKALLLKAGGLDGERISNREMFKLMGNAQLLAEGFQRQSKTLAEREAKIAELEKTLEERDAFIKEKNGAIPAVNGNTPEKKASRTEAAKQFLNPTVR